MNFSKFQREFESDGCTMAFDFTVILLCCARHDYMLWLHRASGAPNTEKKRIEIDRKFRRCMICKAARIENPLVGFFFYCVAWTYWLGVRAFGWVWYYNVLSVKAK